MLSGRKTNSGSHREWDPDVRKRAPTFLFENKEPLSFRQDFRPLPGADPAPRCLHWELHKQLEMQFHQFCKDRTAILSFAWKLYFKLDSLRRENRYTYYSSRETTVSYPLTLKVSLWLCLSF